MHTIRLFRTRLGLLLWMTMIGVVCVEGAGTVLIGWNNLGMHCTDGSDFSVFSILPHYNTIQAHLVVNGKLVTDPTRYSLTYEAVADPDNSINRTSIGKGNFYSFVKPLYGATLAPDGGLAGFAMPGPQNQPQAMRYDPAFKWWIAEGIPITPYDDVGKKNFYPMMRLVARDAQKRVVATTDIVLPVSDEMSCAVCHGSDRSPAARPVGGYVHDPDPNRDYKLNVLKLHDDRDQGKPAYAAALVQAGYSARGLFPTVAENHQPVLCAKCHLSEALPGTGIAGIPPLTAAIHSRHANVIDPVTSKPMDAVDNRASCYRCHPGSETKCLRGVMGNAVASDGTMAIQCQSCHGNMAEVGRAARTGWLEEPNCQSCHTGTAARNNGQIRYLSSFDTPGHLREAVDKTFATSPNTPAPGFSLYRFSKGHGNLQCEACHGSTHAEYPSSHRNDNLQSTRIQGHVGTLAECSSCHSTVPNTVNGGPHGMHPVGQSWIEGHKDPAEHNLSLCRNCHGSDLRGTVLSRSFADRALRTEWGTKTFFRGSQIGCYNCHRGPFDDDRNPNRAPVVSNASLATAANASASLVLAATDADRNALSLRIVSQPAHGTVALSQSKATYFPEPGYAGADVFTFAAWDGSTDSNLGRVSVQVSSLRLSSVEVGTPSRTAPLEILSADAGGLTLAWPASLDPLALEWASSLEAGRWEKVEATPVRVGEQWTVQLRQTNDQRFFRLRAE